MLSGREIELGFMRAGYKTQKEMGDSCGLPRLTIFRIIKKGQKPTVEQLEKIKEVIGEHTKQKDSDPHHNKDPMAELFREEIRKNILLEAEIERLKEEIKELEPWDGKERRISGQRREGGGRK